MNNIKLNESYISLKILFIIIFILIGCLPNKKEHLFFVNIEGDSDQFSQITFPINKITLFGKQDNEKLLEINKSFFHAGLKQSQVFSISSTNLKQLLIELTMDEATVVIPGNINNPTLVQLWDINNQEIPQQETLFKISTPIQRLDNHQKARSLNIKLDINRTFQPMFNESNKQHYLFNPFFSADLEPTKDLNFLIILKQDSNKKFYFIQNNIKFYFSINEDTVWLNEMGITSNIALETLVEEQVELSVQGHYHFNHSHVFTAKSIYFTQSLSLEDSPSTSTQQSFDGVVKLIDEKLYFIFSNDTDQLPIPLLTSNTTKLESMLEVNADFLFDESQLVDFQKITITTANNLSIEKISLLNSSSIVYINNEKINPLYINDIPIDEAEFNEKIDFRFAEKPADGLYQLIGYIDQTEFVVNKLKAIEINQLTLDLVILGDETQNPKIFTDKDQQGFIFSQNLIDNAIASLALNNYPIKMSANIDNLLFTDTGDFDLVIQVNKNETKILNHQTTSDFINTLENHLGRNQLKTINAQGTLQNSKFTSNKMTVALSPFPNDNSAQANTRLTQWEKGAIATGSIVGTGLFFTLARWHNTTLKKPWADFIFQWHAEVNKKPFSGSPLDLKKYDLEKLKGNIKNDSSIVFDTDNNKNVTAYTITSKTHKVDSNEIEYFTNYQKTQTQDISQRKVILYIPGLGEDVAINKKLKLTQGKDPLEHVGKEVDADVFSMNTPPFGNSQWNNSKRFDLDDALEAAKGMYQMLTNLGYKADNMHFWSWSIGGNTAIRLADYVAVEEKKPIGGLILDAPPTKIDDFFTNPAERLLGKMLMPFLIPKTSLDLNNSKNLKSTAALITHHIGDNFISQPQAIKTYSTLFNEFTIRNTAEVKSHKKNTRFQNHYIKANDSSRINTFSNFIYRKK